MLEPPDNLDPERKGESPTAWAFPTRSRCEEADGGCGSLRTVATSTQGHIQYRRCLVCGRCYKVVGQAI